MERTTFVSEKAVYFQGHINIFKCENCGTTFEIAGMIDKWHHCPNCGNEIDSWSDD